MKLPKPIEVFSERLPTANRQLHVLTCAGIGDALWWWSKWWKVAREREVTLWFPDGEPHRAGALCQLWGLRYGYMPNLSSQMVWQYNDDEGDPEIPDSSAVLVVSANRHLENGKRIEKWYPDLPFRNPTPETVATTYKLEAGTPQYIVVSMGAHDYMEGQLLPAQWARALKHIEQTIAPVLIIANTRSEHFAMQVMRFFDPTLAPAMHVPLPELIPVIRRGKALVGTASGITILSTYMGVPTLHAYPRWLKAMPNTWEQEGHISDTCFLDELENAIRDDFLADIIARRDGDGSRGDAPDTEYVPLVHDAPSRGNHSNATAGVVEQSGQAQHPSFSSEAGL